jgi:hypothetical protein
VTLAVVVLVFGLAQNGPEEVPFTPLAQGDRFHREDAIQALITTAKELEDHWKKQFPNAAARPVPKIDFDKEIVVLVALGVRPHSGYAVSVTKIVRTTDTIRVSFKEQLPDPKKKYAQALTSPFVMVRMAKPDRKVEIVEDAK